MAANITRVGEVLLDHDAKIGYPFGRAWIAEDVLRMIGTGETTMDEWAGNNEIYVRVMEATNG